MLNFNLLDKILVENNSFIITTHVNPDADAIGAELAFYRMLKIIKKEVKIINYSSTPYNLEFLDTDKIIEKYCLEIHKDLINSYDVILTLDMNSIKRTVKMADLILNSNIKKVCIDHHQNPEEFADYYFVDTQASATCEIIFDFLFSFYPDLITKDIAIPLYAGIMTDTGSFRFSRTTPKLHRDVAFLIEKGADPFDIYDKIYDQSKFSKVKLLGKALNTIELIYNGKIGFMTITQDDFNVTQAIESDTDNFVNFILSIEGVLFGILFIELPNGFKASFRSKGEIPADLVAKNFGGGGHRNASGARFYNQKLDKNIIDQILNYSINFLQSLGK